MNYHDPHVRLRMEERDITQERADQCIEHGTVSRSANGRDVYDDGDIKVVVHRRNKKVITVLTKDVTMVGDIPFLGGAAYKRLHEQTGVYVHYDREIGMHEVYCRGSGLERALRYLRNMVRTTTAASDSVGS